VQLARAVIGRRTRAAVVANGNLVAATLQPGGYSSHYAQYGKSYYTNNGKTHALFYFVDKKTCF
jgi:hypothetical protein